jgi:hypothetical protein
MKIVIALLLFLSCKTYSQNAMEMSIIYGESIQLGKIEDTVKFLISGEGMSVNLTGEEINNFKFIIPGSYVITIASKEHFNRGECNHSNLPKQIKVYVSGTKMMFDGTKLQLSKPIIKNIDAVGTTISIPVYITTYDGKSVTLNDTAINVVGIGSTLKAKPNISVQELPVGYHLLTYSLSGKVTENAYLMADFVDSEGKIQSVALSNPIQNQ